MRQATKKSVSGKRDATPQRPTRPPSAGKASLAFATTSRLASAPEERIAVTSTRSQTREKAEARKVNLGPSQEALVVLCLLDLGIKFANSGRRGSANVAMNVLFNTRRSLQLHLPKMTSVGRARARRRRRTRGRATVPGRRAEVPIPRRGSQSLKDKAGKPSSPGSAAVCLMRALMMVAVVNPSTSTHRVPEGIASHASFLNQHFAMPVTPNRTVSFGSNVETFEVPIEHDCNLNPCHAKQTDSQSSLHHKGRSFS